MNKILIDTNIFIYDLDRNSIYHIDAVKILNSNNELFTTSKNISEFVSVATKLAVDYRIINNYINDILRNTNILYPNFNSLQIFKYLISKYKPNGNRVYDFEIASIMLDNKIEYIATLNIKDFTNIENILIYS